MSNQSYTDSTIVEYNEDGSQTITTVERYYPPTTQQKIAAWATLGGLAVVAMAPAVLPAVVDSWQERKARKAREKSQQNESK